MFENSGNRKSFSMFKMLKLLKLFSYGATKEKKKKMWTVEDLSEKSIMYDVHRPIF